MSVSAIGNYEASIRSSARKIVDLAHALGANPKWLETGVGPIWASGQDASSMAHPVSLIGHMVAPTTIRWGDLMSAAALPPEFRVALPDDSMAPEARAGSLVSFDRTLTPLPGDWVLVKDDADNWYLREYRQRRPNHWEAHAIDPAYQPLDSLRDGLTVVAVYVGIHARRARGVM